MSSGSVLHDEKTVRYFDTEHPEYSVKRLSFAAQAIAERTDTGSSLVDLGCGAGNTLAYLVEATGVRDVVGVDVSTRLLERCREVVDCPVYRGSIVDDDLATLLGRTFDVAVVAAVLHHLIGRTRAGSRAHARAAIRNALGLLNPGGHLVIVEPILYPRLAMDAVFYIKKALSSVTDRRIFFGDHYWTNFGAPVVSYYGNLELQKMVEDEGGRIVARDIDPEQLGRAAGALLTKTNTTLVAQVARGPVSST
jgi:SAM-dependent methyltransferase